MRRAFWRAALPLGMSAALHGGAAGGPLGIPSVEHDGGRVVRWIPPPSPHVTGAATAVRLQVARDASDSLAAWRAATGDALMRPYALRRMARLALGLGDTARAEGLWASLAAERSPWHWEALRTRSDLALARGEVARADALLENADRREWSEVERGEWLARRVGLRHALGDTARAVEFARQMIARYPANARAPETLATLEALLAAHRDSLAEGDRLPAAEVEWLQGQRAAAAGRLARAPAGPLGARPTPMSLRLARMLRELRRFGEAQTAATAALAGSDNAPDSLEALMEQARILRDTGDGRGALLAYAAVAARAPRGFPALGWERGRFLEERGEWRDARADYARVAADSGGRRDEATLRAGLMSLAAGEADSALDWFAQNGSEAAEFWRGVVLRRLQRPSGDSLLRALAARPGYTFYRAAARDSLGVRGWPARATAPRSVPVPPALRSAQALDALGLGEDAALVLDRWAAGERRLGVPALSAGPGLQAWLEAAMVAYAGGRPRQGIWLAERAVSGLAAGPDSVAWWAALWLYPPAFDSLFAAFPESVAAGGIERALLQAVVWKESRFDPRARSRSDAVGLLQLKRAAVSDIAGWFRERPPSDSTLADPALNLRYGARYLERQLARFPGNLPLALAAYNAGPSVAKRWNRLRAVGGDALACEEIDFPETRDYVKTILAVRQAYRELKPEVEPGR